MSWGAQIATSLCHQPVASCSVLRYCPRLGFRSDRGRAKEHAQGLCSWCGGQMRSEQDYRIRLSSDSVDFVRLRFVRCVVVGRPAV